MEERERSRSRSPRRVRRVEQVVGRWLRRSRDSLSRERILGDRKSGRSDDGSQQHFPVRETVEVIRDSVLDSHGFTLSTQLPLLVRDVTPGGPADGRLLPGDQLLKVNNKAIDDLSPELVENMIRECQDSVTVTILRNMLNPKSSFMTAEKRARLRRNPVKVHFAEEVVVNGHTQGNSLLFLPNVLKVYLENGQTKAFKFDKTTTVKDIELTLKDKLSIQCIEYFSLVLEQQYSITKLLLLHEDELIQKVVQKKDSHDYRCLFRVCFIPRDPVDLLHDDPVAFEYLFHQSVGDVLQERFAVEMKCNTALRLAALHMHERMASCGHTTRASVKSITKEFGLESFISSTLLRNMKEKDLRKALTGHMKKIQSLLEPRQKVFSVPQARLAYLTQMAELISFSGRSYNATMLLQDRESLVSLLVGARYGISQILNHKLNMISTIIDFHYISRVEVLSESDRVSMLKIYLHDIQPLALLMDSVSAKDLACLLAGYCKLLVDPNMNVFRWGPRPKIRRIPLEEGYGFRCGSDSDESSEEDYPMDNCLDTQHSKDNVTSSAREDGKKEGDKQEIRAETVRVIVTQAEVIVNAEGDGFEGTSTSGFIEDEDYAARVEALLETGWYTDPRVNSSFSSLSSNSLNALEESSRAYTTGLFQEEIPKSDQATGSSLDVHHPYLLEVPEQLNQDDESQTSMEPALRYGDYSQMSDYLLSPTEASDDALSDLEGDENRNYRLIPGVSADLDTVLASGSSSNIKSTVAGVNAQALLTRIRSHPACKQEWDHSNLGQREQTKKFARVKAPPPPPPPRTVSSRLYETTKESRDNCSESEDEFFDAQDRLTPPVLDPAGEKDTDVSGRKQAWRMTDGKVRVEKTLVLENPQNNEDQQNKNTSLPASGNSLKKKASSLTQAETVLDNKELEVHQPSMDLLPQQTLREYKPVLDNQISEQTGQQCNGEIPGRNSHLSSELLEMEPDTMEFKPVSTAGPPLSSPLITAVWQGKSQLVTTVDPEKPWNGGEQQQETSSNAPACLDNAIPSHAPVCLDNSIPSHMHVKTSDNKNISKPREFSEGRRDALIKIKKTTESQTLPIYEPKKNVNLKPPVPPKPASIVFQPSSIPNIDPALKPDGKKHVPLNGLSLHSWSQQKGTNPAPALSKGVSLSHENLRSELKTENTTVKVTSVSTTPTPTSTPTPSPSVVIRGSVSMDPKDPFGIGVSLSSRTSSGRLSASALRGKIQDMPWYLTRSQEILGTVALSGNKSANTKASTDKDEHKEPIKETPKVTSVPSLNDWKDKDAEVVVVKLKDGPQQVASLVKETSETSLSGHLDLNQNGLHSSTELYSHLGTCKSEQPQSQKDCGIKDSLERPSPPSSTDTPHREACGCHTVYAHCFSGDVEDTCSFDDDLTVYEFSRQKRIGKPPQTFSMPSSLTAPSPNILSLLRDSPRPLSTSSELSPLLTPPRPLEPRLLGCSPLENPLRDLQSRRYMMGPKGTGLKGGYTSLHRDIDELLLVLKNGESAIKPACHKEQCEKGSGVNGHSITESDRCLVQAEARRLASGCQRATRVSWAPDDALLSLGNSFGALVHLAAACLRVSCSDCGGCHGDIDGVEALRKLQEIVCLYKEFVTAVEMTQEGEGVRLLAKQCTVLISTVFSLTQLFRTRTPDTENRHLPLNF